MYFIYVFYEPIYQVEDTHDTKAKAKANDEKVKGEPLIVQIILAATVDILGIVGV